MSTESRFRRVRNETRIFLVELWTRQDRTSTILAALMAVSAVANMLAGNWVIAMLMLIMMSQSLFLKMATSMADEAHDLNRRLLRLIR